MKLENKEFGFDSFAAEMAKLTGGLGGLGGGLSF